MGLLSPQVAMFMLFAAVDFHVRLFASHHSNAYSHRGVLVKVGNMPSPFVTMKRNMGTLSAYECT